MKPAEPDKVKFLCGILYSDIQLLEKALKLLTDQFGPIDFRSTDFPFNQTEYYIAEMGNPIYRLFIAFEKLMHPGTLAQIKRDTGQTEGEYRFRLYGL